MKQTGHSTMKAFLICFCLTGSVSNAQLKVTSQGRVGVGPVLAPTVAFHVQGNAALFSSSANPIRAPYIRCGNNFSGPANPDYTWLNEDQTGIFHPGTGSMAFGIWGNEIMRINNNGAGIFSAGPNSGMVFTVNGSGLVTGNWWVLSDQQFKKNIKTIENSINKLSQIRGVTYEYKTEENKDRRFESGPQLGFIAQELKMVFPEAVKETDNGVLTVNYQAIIPVLVEALKEQQKQIEELKQQNAGRSSALGTTGLSSTTSTGINSEKAVLYQNAPNPFNIETTIKYSVPSTAKSANIFVYDINGNKKKSFSLSERGEGNIKIAANGLSQGIYFYSMVIDGEILDSKTMLITE